MGESEPGRENLTAPESPSAGALPRSPAGSAGHLAESWVRALPGSLLTLLPGLKLAGCGAPSHLAPAGHPPLLFPARSAPLVRCRRRGLGAVPGEGGGSRAGGGSQDEASDSAPSRSGLQCSSYKRNDGSVSCFLGISGRSGSERSAAPPPPPSTSCSPRHRHRPVPYTLTFSPAGHSRCPGSPWQTGCCRS